jgi:pimeloyl-ACP methyl ester carboxylesterase
MGQKIKAELKPGSWFCGFFMECEFDLHYFFGSNYNGPKPGQTSNPNGNPLILFIPGGPGEIVHRETPYFWLMTRLKKANVVYFDIRGTGFSVIPESNDYDRFLRAEYVVEDIETLRKTLMNECSRWDLHTVRNCKSGVTPWDAIYATSWGTIVAQQYAARYPNMVNKLILAAPVSRGHRDTEQARRKMIIDNLFDIFDKHRTKDKCSWDPSDSVVKNALNLLSEDLKKVENFCFLSDKEKSFIKNSFLTLLNTLESDYGSVNLVNSFYEQFRNDAVFWEKYPYPREFFAAIRELEDFGAGEQPGLMLDHETKRRKVGAAMYLAYYLSLPKEALTHEKHELHPGNGNFPPNCKKPDADFFSGVQDTDGDILKINFCYRIQRGWYDLNLDVRSPSFNHSARARTVFSVHDGLAQWIFEIMKKERRVDNQGCFAGKDVQDIARGDSQLQTIVIHSTVIREQARKLGIRPTDRFCPWDPARLEESGKCKHCHDKDTLILKGGADAITAGDQAEYLFDKALALGHRTLIEFSGAGHFMNYQVKIEDPKQDRLDKVIKDFTAAAGSKIETEAAYKALLDELNERRGTDKQAAKEAKVPSVFWGSLHDVIIEFVNSNTIHDFTQNEKAMKAIKTLGGCLRTEDNEEFSKCVNSEM